jgi:hypothetical protein
MISIRTTLGMGLLLSAVSAGCGRDQPVTVPVSGHITFAGGPCPAGGTIVFSPVAVEKGLPRRPGTARFQPDGAFTVTSFREGDGLIPGHYRPIISCWKGEPGNDDPSSFERLNNVPKNYQPDEVVVEPSAPEVVVRLDVPKK